MLLKSNEPDTMGKILYLVLNEWRISETNLRVIRDQMKSEQGAPASKVHSFCLEYEIFPEMHSKDGFQHCQ